MAEHLAPDDLLQEYAAGNLSEPLSLLVATHIALKPESRQAVRFYEDIGGALMEASAPEARRPPRPVMKFGLEDI